MPSMSRRLVDLGMPEPAAVRLYRTFNTGAEPFRAESAVAVAMMQVRDAPPPLPDTVPAPIRQLIDATLVKDPTQRYGTGGEFAEAV